MPTLKLPSPRQMEKHYLTDLLRQRRSIRNYSVKPLDLNEISDLLWCCDGKNADWGGRTAPSAGATYPLDIYLVAGDVTSLAAGLYSYHWQTHSLTQVRSGDWRKQLAESSYNQKMLLEAPVTIVIAATAQRTTSRYGERGYRYIYLEAGHCGQNIHLACVSLHLATVMVGAFDDARVKDCLGLKQDILYLCPVGHPLP